MDEALLRALLPGLPALRLYGRVDSTNALALAWARGDAPHGAVVIADSQEKGRGRRGRAFHSPPGGLYLSLIVDTPGLGPGQVTTLAAVAAALAIGEVLGVHAGIKWVNDLLYAGRKVGGILCEGVLLEGRLGRTVIGIGLNTGYGQFPESLLHIAGPLPDQGVQHARERLAAAIIPGILKGLRAVPAHMGEYRSRCVTLRQPVAFEQGGRAMQGQALDVDDEGALLVRTEKEDIRLLAGDVSLNKPVPGA